MRRPTEMYDADKRTLDPQVRMLATREIISIENDAPTDAEIEALEQELFGAGYKQGQRDARAGVWL